MLYRYIFISLIFLFSYGISTFSAAPAVNAQQLYIKQKLDEDQRFLDSFNNPETVRKWKRSQKSIEKLLSVMDTRLDFYEKILMDKECKSLWQRTVQIALRLLSVRKLVTFKPENLKKNTASVTAMRTPKFLRKIIIHPKLATIHEEKECKEHALLDTDEVNMPN